MPVIEDAKIRKHLDTQELYPVYVFYGPEKFLVRRESRRLKSKAEKNPFPEFNLNEFGSEASVDEIADAALALPLFAERKFVFISDLDPEARSAGELAKLTELLESPSESTVLVFTYPTLELPPKETAKWKNFLKLCGKQGGVVEFRRKEKPELVKYLQAAAEKSGASLSKYNAEKLLEACGPDLNALSREMEKLTAYCSGREITAEDIAALVPQNMEAKVFALSGAILRGNYDEAYRVLRNLLYSGENPVSILAVLSSSFVDMYRVKAALQSGKKASAPAEYGEYRNKEFLLERAERSAAGLSDETLKKCLDILLETDLKLKGSRIPPARGMEEMISRLLLAIQGEK